MYFVYWMVSRWVQLGCVGWNVGLLVRCWTVNVHSTMTFGALNQLFYLIDC